MIRARRYLINDREPEFLYVLAAMARVGAYLKGTRPLKDCLRK